MWKELNRHSLLKYPKYMWSIMSLHAVNSGESQETSVETKICLLLEPFYPMEHFYK